MDRFFVVTNEARDPGARKARMVCNYLKDAGKVCDHVSIERHSDPDGDRLKKIRELPDDTEAVIVLGGDGTFIQCAGLLAPKNIPMIGVNLGHLGYLAEVEKEKITPALDRLINSDFTIEERMLLSGTIVIDKKEQGAFPAVNDIVVRSCEYGVGSFCIEVNGTYLTTISGDGVIVATPTGSTAYNMSAGGPIIEPLSSMIVITPICPLEVVSRSVVLSAADKVVIRVAKRPGRPERDANVYFDGGKGHPLSEGDEVLISKADSSIRLIKLSKESFLEVLSRKMQ